MSVYISNIEGIFCYFKESCRGLDTSSLTVTVEEHFKKVLLATFSPTWNQAFELWFPNLCMQQNLVEVLLEQRFWAPPHTHSVVSGSVSLRWDLQLFGLKNSQVRMMLLVWGPQLEKRITVAVCWDTNCCFQWVVTKHCFSSTLSSSSSFFFPTSNVYNRMKRDHTLNYIICLYSHQCSFPVAY